MTHTHTQTNFNLLLVIRCRSLSFLECMTTPKDNLATTHKVLKRHYLLVWQTVPLREGLISSVQLHVTLNKSLNYQNQKFNIHQRQFDNYSILMLYDEVREFYRKGIKTLYIDSRRISVQLRIFCGCREIRIYSLVTILIKKFDSNIV